MKIGFGTERVLEAGFAGLNARTCDCLTVKFKYTPTVVTSGDNTITHQRKSKANSTDVYTQIPNILNKS